MTVADVRVLVAPAGIGFILTPDSPCLGTFGRGPSCHKYRRPRGNVHNQALGRGPTGARCWCQGTRRSLAPPGEMEASWTISQPISIVKGLRLQVASLSLACSGNLKGSSSGSLYLPCCCLDSGCLDPPPPLATAPPTPPRQLRERPGKREVGALASVQLLADRARVGPDPAQPLPV